MNVIVNDWKGKLITVGCRVVGDPAQPGGVVKSISEPDGDLDDEGKPYGINPYVYVQWDGDDDVEGLTTTWTAKGPWDEDAPYECDDLEVVPA